MLNCFGLSALFTIGVIAHSGLEGFIVGPDCSIEYLECCFSCFGCERGKTSELVSIVEGGE